ncbi:hypothetical protein LR48_Vigan09g088300 [Vigna angularis]|uniref:Putative plant transposon protein domain-containing protein n=1 Tax=Phaseolus angularis TaxID=3914 RepID=A0A0L9VC33_PHAAN|nr:hypothetical protein LR48_Vigan09g088300 [Vigna angularis]
MTSSSGKRIKTVGNKRKEPEWPYSNKFLSHRHEQHFISVQDRRLLMERKAGWIPDLAPQFGEELENKNWEKIATYPAPANIAVVKEFYTNARRLGNSHTEDYMSYVRGKSIRYDPYSINRFLHVEWTGEQCQFVLNMVEGVDYDDMERLLCVPEGHFQRNRNGAVVRIRKADLAPMAKYWMAFSHANIQPCSHVSNITVSREKAPVVYVYRHRFYNRGICGRGPPSLHLLPRHPDEAFTGFCPACLCKCLVLLDPNNNNNLATARKPPSIAAVAALKALFRPRNPRRKRKLILDRLIGCMNDGDEDDDDDFEDAEVEGEEEDSDDSMG